MLRIYPPLHLVLGPIVWAAWFVIMYTSLSVVCKLAPPTTDQGAMTWINGALLGLTLLVVLLLVVQGYRCWQEAFANTSVTSSQPFLGKVSAGVYLFTAFSTLMIGLPVVLYPPCI